MASKVSMCKQIAAFPYIKCTYRTFGEEFRVTLDGLSREREEAVAYYTSDYEDAMDTARFMSRHRSEEIAAALLKTEIG